MSGGKLKDAAAMAALVAMDSRSDNPSWWSYITSVGYSIIRSLQVSYTFLRKKFVYLVVIIVFVPVSYHFHSKHSRKTPDSMILISVIINLLTHCTVISGYL